VVRVDFRQAASHGLKAGVEYQHTNVFRNAARYARGLLTFNREFTADLQNRAATGDGLAEFMLDWAAAGNLGNENGENLMANSMAAFIQDDWKISSHIPVNPWNVEQNRGNSYNDVRRQWAFSAAYELPFGKGKAMLNRGRAVNALFGGWQLAALASLRTGLPFTVITSGGLTNAGRQNRPNRIADGTLPASQRTIDH
jgi:hypothetical protein